MKASAFQNIIQQSKANKALNPDFQPGTKGVSMLPPSVKGRMESSFQTDFSNVNIHTNSASATDLNALAYTQGTDIHFAPGQFNPSSLNGRQLIGHELTHVVQQAQGNVQPTIHAKGLQINNSPVLEKEADELGAKAAAGQQVSIKNGLDSGHSVQMKCTKCEEEEKATAQMKSNSGVIQKDDDEEGFSINFDLLPPELRMQLWVLALDANTSRVRLSFDESGYSGNLSYNYGGNISGGFGVGDFSSRFSVDPSSGDFNLGLGTSEAMFGVSPLSGDFSFSGASHGFRYGANAGLGSGGSFGLNIGYGAPLLPMPWDFGSNVTAGAAGLHNMAGGMGSFMDDPLAWYDLHSDDVSAIGDAVTAGRRIAEQQGGPNFGAGLRLNYSPELGFTIFTGVQGTF